MSFKSGQYHSTLPKYLFPYSENSRKVFEKFRDIWIGLTELCPLHTRAVDSALAQGEVCSHYYTSPQNRTVSGGCKCPPRLRSCSTTLSKEWIYQWLASDFFFFMILSVLSLRYIQEQVSKMGINRDKVRVSVKKESAFPIRPKETSLFLCFAKYYLQFRISIAFAVSKISRKVPPLYNKMHLKWALPVCYSQLPRSK